jgi:hypothetical protein
MMDRDDVLNDMLNTLQAVKPAADEAVLDQLTNNILEQIKHRKQKNSFTYIAITVLKAGLSVAAVLIVMLFLADVYRERPSLASNAYVKNIPEIEQTEIRKAEPLALLRAHYEKKRERDLQRKAALDRYIDKFKKNISL